VGGIRGYPQRKVTDSLQKYKADDGRMFIECELRKKESLNG
jgi:hypothetical protein